MSEYLKIIEMSKEKEKIQENIEEEKEEIIAEKVTQVVEEDKEHDEHSESKETLENNLESQLAEAKDKYLRLYSEFENFRRRTSKEKLELVSIANKELMADLVPVLDDFERAVNASRENSNIEALKEGVSLVQNKLNKTLEAKGLKKMEISKGDEFNDDKHEAITQIPTEKNLEGKVVDVVEAGYILGESVVRFAKVVVGAKQ
ncbi:MAG: nucleotide exchange factor GrpE [Bacteroidota bacterium]